mmetsp:Transcript_36702/g.113137  ORF Transcript_36702/g.113137 Transcript_36702/m.113137 type:complete len:349 (+) Transcript_36702:514-1560(+)
MTRSPPGPQVAGGATRVDSLSACSSVATRGRASRRRSAASESRRPGNAGRSILCRALAKLRVRWPRRRSWSNAVPHSTVGATHVDVTPTPIARVLVLTHRKLVSNAPVRRQPPSTAPTSGGSWPAWRAMAARSATLPFAVGWPPCQPGVQVERLPAWSVDPNPSGWWRLKRDRVGGSAVSGSAHAQRPRSRRAMGFRGWGPVRERESEPRCHRRPLGRRRVVVAAVRQQHAGAAPLMRFGEPGKYTAAATRCPPCSERGSATPLWRQPLRPRRCRSAPPAWRSSARPRGEVRRRGWRATCAASCYAPPGLSCPLWPTVPTPADRAVEARCCPSQLQEWLCLFPRATRR